MDPRELALYLANALDDKKALNIIILDVEDLVGYTSYFVVASGRGERHVQSLADHLRRNLRAEQGIRPFGVEGTKSGRWALLDFGDVVVHIFREDERDFYDLEGLWRDAAQLERENVAEAVGRG
ncbi:MAG: ribosome silencing factor [Myxococcota bacterium]|nr:ribosome silencing factor [Myxococcota bacterium]